MRSSVSKGRDVVVRGTGSSIAVLLIPLYGAVDMIGSSGSFFTDWSIERSKSLYKIGAAYRNKVQHLASARDTEKMRAILQAHQQQAVSLRQSLSSQDTPKSSFG